MAVGYKFYSRYSLTATLICHLLRHLLEGPSLSSLFYSTVFTCGLRLIAATHPLKMETDDFD